MKKFFVKGDVVFIFIILSILLNISYVGAFSIATLYGDSYPLKMKAGETKETFFLLRNVAEGDSDVVVKVELNKNSEVVSLIDGSKIYELPFGTEVEVPLKITIPGDAESGKTYNVGAMFRPAPGKAEGGNIQFLVNIGKSFPVVIEGKSGEGEASSLTLEEDKDITESFAPSFKKGTNIWSICHHNIACLSGY